MTERRNSNPGQRIQVFLALGICNPATLTMAESHRQPGIGIHDMRHEATPKNENGGHRRRNDRHSTGKHPARATQA
ncbi:MAG: hypothetical protein ABIK25_12735 [Pseudomonadota bacterium]